ncbi:MAG TPA: DNA recombination protein RmuC [Rhodanobacteraceae bacterium]|nr:DNA recombination protein RmuC [Rhodanobacteraceae bacterium]
MPDLPPVALAIVAALIGVLVGALIVLAFARRWVARALAAGRAARDGEVAVLIEQRDAATARTADLSRRIERFESEWPGAEQTRRQLTAHAATQQAHAERLTIDLADARRSRDDLQQRLQDLSGRYASLEASAREQAQAATEKLQLLDQAEQRLREAFQNLANRILDDKAERLREQSALQLGGLLDPLKTQLKEFRETVNQTHASDQRERGMLTQEIQSLKQLNQRISEDAINLTRALKGDPRTQGAWGELVLERLLEASGLEKGRAYDTQTVLRDESGGRPRPDVIVHLPGGRDIIIDAKVSLTAYERYCAAVDDDERSVQLSAHIASIRSHVKELAERRYGDLAGVNSLEFVLMFVPVEAAYIEAVHRDQGLHAFALEQHVAIVTTSTLLATLQTVKSLWSFDDRNRNAVEIADRAGKLYDKFVGFVADLQDAGAKLEGAREALASATGKLQTGRGNLVSQVEKLRELGAKTAKTLPTDMIEPAELDEVQARLNGDAT